MKKDKNISKKLKAVILEAISDKKGDEIIELDLSKIDSAVAETFVLCHGNSTTQVSAIANNVYKEVKDQCGLLPLGHEGNENANWIVIDYFDVVVHVFRQETRSYYQLEELWSDARFINHK